MHNPYVSNSKLHHAHVTVKSVADGWNGVFAHATGYHFIVELLGARIVVLEFAHQTLVIEFVKNGLAAAVAVADVDDIRCCYLALSFDFSGLISFFG